MNVQLLSDLHIEFHQDRGAAWIDALTPPALMSYTCWRYCGGKDGLLVDVLRNLRGPIPQVVFVLGITSITFFIGVS